MWFDLLMDDLKAALEISDKYHGVFVPVFLKLLMGLILGTFFVMGIGISVISGIFAEISEVGGFKVLLSFFTPLVLLIILGYIIYLILWALIEVGSINLYFAAMNDEKPTRAHFFNGIRKYLNKVFAGKLLIHFLVLVLSPLWLVMFVIYAIVIGIPTAGWGILFLAVAIGAYFATWTIAIVHDDLGVMAGIGASFRLARRHFKPMFIIILSLTMISNYAVWILGPVGFVFLGWLIGGIVKTFFRIGLYKTYLRYREERETL